MMTTTTIEFNDIEFIVSIDSRDADGFGHRATISYPSFEESGFDPSAGSEDAYPTAEIEAFVSRCVGRPVTFFDCPHAGCDAAAWETWRFREVEEPAVVSLDNGWTTTDVEDMDDEQLALCLREAATLDAEIIEAEHNAHDSDREYVAAYALRHLALYGAVWTLP